MMNCNPLQNTNNYSYLGYNEESDKSRVNETIIVAVNLYPRSTMSSLAVSEVQGQLVVDSRLIAEELGIAFELWEFSVVSALGSFPSNLSIWNLLAIMRHSSLTADTDWDIPKLIDKVFYFALTENDKWTVNWLKLAVIEGIGSDILARTSESGLIHPWFQANYKNFITNAELVPVIAKQGKRPDFLVNIDGVVCPVECKLIFGKPALKQLQGYMNLWQSSIGYAVANKFKVNLPSNIIKIQRNA